MVGIRSVLKTAALVSVLFVSAAAAADTPSDTPPAGSSGSPTPTPTPTPSPTPTPTTIAPATTATVQRQLTVQATCVLPTLKIVDKQIGIYCNGAQVSDSALTLESSMDLEIGVLQTNSEFSVGALETESIDKLTIHGGAPGQTYYTGVKPNLKFDGVSGLSKLSSLSLSNVNFTSVSLNLQIPVTLAYMKIESTNVENVSFVVSDKSNMKKIDFLNNPIGTIPKCLYERQYNQTIEANVNFTQTSESLSADIVKILKHNINFASSSFEIDNNCDSSTVAPTTLGAKYKVCTLAGSTASPSSSGTSSSSNSTGTPVAGSTSKKSSSNTTLIVVIVLVVAVSLVLAAALFARLAAARKKNTPQSDDNSVNLIGKDDASGNGKLSFISSDESLRALRLQQNEVTLSKSLGTGRLWLGEFAGTKVIVKRVEAEVSDAYVTKNLMNQSQVLASISHENIVPLVGVTWLAGTDFAVVAEFMDKSNLKAVLADANWQLDIQTKLRMCLDIARGLAYLHDSERNMYVNNLSSGKVLVNSSSECKLNLFDVYPSTTKIEFPIETYGAGEIAWQAPELITHFAPQDPRKINMYAFGVIMCEILARASPFQTLVEELGNTLSDVEIVKRVRRQETLAPHENRREYMRAPQSLRDTIDLCLSLSPLNRPSASDIIVALEAAQLEVSATQQLV